MNVLGLGNPVGSAIDAFSKIRGIQRADLAEENAQEDRQTKMSDRVREQARQDSMDEQTKKMWAQQNDDREKAELSGALQAQSIKHKMYTDKGMPIVYDQEDSDLYKKILKRSGHYGTAGQYDEATITKQAEGAIQAANEFGKLQPAIMAAMTSGKGGILSEEQAPEAFASFNQFLGDDGKGGKVTKVILAPKGQAATFVKSVNGVEKPVVAGDPDHGDSPVKQVPIQLLQAYMKTHSDFAQKFIDSRLQNDPEYRKQVEGEMKQKEQLKYEQTGIAEYQKSSQALTTKVDVSDRRTMLRAELIKAGMTDSKEIDRIVKEQVADKPEKASEAERVMDMDPADQKKYIDTTRKLTAAKHIEPKGSGAGSKSDAHAKTLWNNHYSKTMTELSKGKDTKDLTYEERSKRARESANTLTGLNIKEAPEAASRQLSAEDTEIKLLDRTQPLIQSFEKVSPEGRSGFNLYNRSDTDDLIQKSLDGGWTPEDIKYAASKSGSKEMKKAVEKYNFNKKSDKKTIAPRPGKQQSTPAKKAGAPDPADFDR